MQTVSIIERAFQLAGDGKHRSIDEIRKTLKAERYDTVTIQIRSGSLTAQLRAKMKLARMPK